MNTINMTTFEELKRISGEDIIDELIQAFLDEAPIMVGQLKSAFGSGDVDVFRRNAHTLKSNAATFGAEELAALAKDLEHLAREKSLAEVGEKLDNLVTLCATVQAELKGMMK